MFVNRHHAAGERIPKMGLSDLPASIADGDGVVFGHDPLGLDREDPFQVVSAAAPERGSLFSL